MTTISKPRFIMKSNIAIEDAELEARKALKMRMKKYRGVVRSDIDEKAELAQARSEKYEN